MRGLRIDTIIIDEKKVKKILCQIKGSLQFVVLLQGQGFYIETGRASSKKSGNQA